MNLFPFEQKVHSLKLYLVKIKKKHELYSNTNDFSTLNVLRERERERERGRERERERERNPSSTLKPFTIL